jgi:hypothetical protein
LKQIHDLPVSLLTGDRTTGTDGIKGKRLAREEPHLDQDKNDSRNLALLEQHPLQTHKLTPRCKPLERSSKGREG